MRSIWSIESSLSEECVIVEAVEEVSITQGGTYGGQPLRFWWAPQKRGSCVSTGYVNYATKLAVSARHTFCLQEVPCVEDHQRQMDRFTI